MKTKQTPHPEASHDYPWQHHIKMIHFGVMFTILIGITPVLLWVLGPSADFDELFGTPAALFRTLAKTTAFSALALFAWTSILGLRIRPIMKLFGGFINKYRVHAKLGRTSLMLAILHPLLLTVSLGLSEDSNWFGIFNVTDLAILTGYISLISTIALIVLAVSKKIKHASWIKIHNVLAWIVPFHFIHALIGGTELRENVFMIIFFSALVLAQILSYIIYTFFDSLVVKKHHYIIAEVNSVNETVTEVVLAPSEAQMHHEPGQFAYFSIKGSQVVDSEPHPFTISTADNGKYLRIAVKALGDWSSALKDVEKDLEVIVEGPYGNFIHKEDPEETQVWIAGGVGITPFLSMARSLTNEERSNIVLFYAAKDKHDAAFFNEILDISKLCPNVLTSRLIAEDVSGFLTTDSIKEEIGDELNNAKYYMCGPPGMMGAMRKGLAKENVEPERIITEEFSY